ncbi:MAG: type I restriction enzyme HsdR N-terminal domain-containing protein [Nitrospirota bacterium]|nr:type I restriction enzyme HsdR N-terminal domain-containing protein [Nitrospirota bacterium]
MKEFKAALKKFLPKIKDARDRNLNEADTRMRIRLLLSDVLGYDILEDITQEHMVQGHYVDMTVKYKGQVKFFLEAKSVDTNLKDTHVYQATNYAATAGVNLCILTNGIEYRLYNISWNKSKVDSTLAFSVNILDDPFEEAVERLWLLSRESVRKGFIDKFIAEITSLSDRNLLQALMAPRVISSIRRELKDNTGHNVREEAVQKSIKKLFSDELYEIVKECLKKPARPKASKPEGEQPAAVNVSGSAEEKKAEAVIEQPI